jgi:small subunit ribosomal protein S11
MGKKKIKDIHGGAQAVKTFQKGKTTKNKVRRQIKYGQVHIQATYNNTIVTLCDATGHVLVRSSAGVLGYKGAKKATPYAASQIVEHACNLVKPYGLEIADVFVRGIGMGRDTAIRSLIANGLTIQSIRDVTPLPHNGCRSKRPRRV